MRMQSLLDDSNAACRALIRRPGYSVLAILILALGIGATTAIWSVLDPALLRAESFDQTRDLVSPWQRIKNAPDLQLFSHSERAFEAYGSASTLEGVARYEGGSVALYDGNSPARVDGARIGHRLLPLLRTVPLLGRGFDVEDRGRSVVLIHETLWRERFAGQAEVLGRQLEVDGEPHRIVGVMGAPFTFPRSSTRIWRPLREPRDDEAEFGMAVIARLAKGVSIKTAEQELSTLLGQAEGEQAASTKSVHLHMRTRDRFGAHTKSILWLLLGAVGVLLLAACANAANLGFTQGARRRGEFSVRRSLGASRVRLVRTLVLEGLILSLAGAAFGLLVAGALLPVLLRLAPHGVRQRAAEAPGLDLRVLLFATLVALVVAALVGLIPALRSTVRTEQTDRMTSSIRARRRGTTLAGVQIALAFVLLFAAGLLLRSLDGLIDIAPGFQPKDILAIDLVPGANHEDDGAAAYYAQIEQRLEALPFVLGASTARNVAPDAGIMFNVQFQTEQDSADLETGPLRMSHTVLAPDGFALLQLPLVAGSTFSAEGVDEVVLGASVTDRFWPDRDPSSVVGERVRFYAQQPWQTVVGVAAKVRQSGPLEVFGDDMEIYSRVGARSFANRTLLVKTDGDALAHLPDVRAAIWQVDDRVPLHGIRTLESEWAKTMAKPRFLLEIISVLAALTLLLTVAGLYAVLAEAVQSRRREIGVRVTLGARARSVGWLVVRQALVAAVLGIGGGLALSRLGSTWLASQLFSVNTLDLGVLCGTVGVTLVLVLLAAIVPARSALGVHPAEMLRRES